MDSAEFLDLLGNANRRRILQLLAQKPCYVTEISEQLGVSPKAVIDHLRKLEEAGLVESRTDDRRRKYFSISRHVSLEVTVSPYEFGTRSAYPSNSRFDITSCRQVSIDLDSFDHRSDEVGTLPNEEEEAGDGGAANPTSGERVTAGNPDIEDPETSTENPDNPGDTSSTTPDNPDEAASVNPDNPGETALVTGDVATLARQLYDFKQLERELSLVHRWTEGRITELREHLAERIAVGDPRLVSELLVALAEEPHEMEALCRRLGAPPPVVEELLEVLAGEGIVGRDGRNWYLAE